MDAHSGDILLRHRAKMIGRALAIAVLATFPFAANRSAQAQSGTAPMEVSLAWVPTPIYLPVAVADKEGLFAEEGLKVHLLEFRSGTEQTAAMLSGSADFSATTADRPLLLLEKGMPAKNLVAISSTLPIALVVRPELGLKFDRDSLRGRKFGVTAFGSGADLAMRALLASIGLSPERDASFVAIGAPYQLAALESKQVDGIMAPEPAIGVAVAHKTGQVLVDLRLGQGDEKVRDLSFMTIQATDGYISKNQEASRRMVKAIVAAQKRIARGGDDIIQTYGKYFKDLPADVVKSAFASDRAIFKSAISEKMIKNMVDGQLEAGLIKQQHAYQDVVWTPASSLWQQ